MQNATLEITGMSCQHCAAAVRKALEALPSVRVDEVHVGGAIIDYDPARTTNSQICEAVEDAGYHVLTVT